MASITLRGREIPLIYTVLEMKTFQEEIAPLGNVYYAVSGRDKDDPKNTDGYAGPEHLSAVAKAIRIMGNAALEEAGETADLTDRWILRSLRPAQIPAAVNAVLETINESWASEIQKEDNGEPVDVTLEEMKKKETKVG